MTTQGLFISGEWGLLTTQIAAVLVTYGVAIVGCLACLGVTGLVTGGLRVSEDDEFAGLDLSQHSENAYVFATGGYESTTSGIFSPRSVGHGAALAAKAAE